MHYISNDIANRIKERAKQQGISISILLSDCELGKNTIVKMSNGTDILTQNFAKIADRLDCSVDYLLGRTNNPEINKNEPIAAETQQSPSDYAEIAAEGGSITRGPLRKKPETTL